MQDALSRIKNLCDGAIQKPDEKLSLYDIIFKCIKKAIENNDIPSGSALPSTRKLAEALNVSRSTIVQVYELLKIGKLIISRPGSNNIVQRDVNSQLKINIFLQNVQYPNLSESGVSFLKTLPLLESIKDEETAFRPGLPPLDIFPVNQWKVLNNLYWRHVKDADLGHVTSSGTNKLRETLASYLNYTRKIKCDPRQIIIVSGSLQSIYTIGTILLNPGDTIVHENPTFPNVISIFKGLQCNVIDVPLDDQGIMVSALPNKQNFAPKIVHTVPSCHYPTGIRMSIARRLELIEWANQNNSVIIENDYEHEVNNFIDFLPSIYSLDSQQRTFFLGTFNRLMHPSIRIGYMVVPPCYLDATEALLRHFHRYIPNSIQQVLSHFIEKNYLYHHIKNLIQVAEERKEYFCKTFNAGFEGAIQLCHSETKSLHIMAKLKGNISDLQLINAFRAQNITAHSLSKTYINVDENVQQGLILGYAPANKKEMKEKIIKMEQVYRKFKLANSQYL